MADVRHLGFVDGQFMVIIPCEYFVMIGLPVLKLKVFEFLVVHA